MPQTPPPKRHPYDQWSPDARALDLVGDKWSLLIVRDLSSGPRRFVELQRVLPGISTEQLRSRLNRMVADGLLTRQRFREVPPRVEYGLTERAKELMPVLGALARWGYEWAWSPPRSAEAVDLGAIFRLIPGLLEPSHIQGKVSLVVRDGETKTTYTVSASGDEVTLAECEESGADARVEGDPAAWIRTLSPEHARDGLQISGNSDLAAKVLDPLTTAGHPEAAAANSSEAAYHAA
jgi:DNA-binding HxlR family transcriptional regulator